MWKKTYGIIEGLFLTEIYPATNRITGSPNFWSLPDVYPLLRAELRGDWGEVPADEGEGDDEAVLRGELQAHLRKKRQNTTSVLQETANCQNEKASFALFASGLCSEEVPFSNTVAFCLRICTSEIGFGQFQLGQFSSPGSGPRIALRRSRRARGSMCRWGGPRGCPPCECGRWWCWSEMRQSWKKYQNWRKLFYSAKCFPQRNRIKCNEYYMNANAHIGIFTLAFPNVPITLI